MAALHAQAFPEARAWPEAEIASLIAPPGFFVASEAGFAIGRVVAGEAELITIAVAPAQRGKGMGHALLSNFETKARTNGATRAFLEVAADNAPARALYAHAGWEEVGRRKGYYPRIGGPVDALVLARDL